MAIVDRYGQAEVMEARRFRVTPDTHVPWLRYDRPALPPIPSGGTAEIRLVAGYSGTFAELPADLAQAVMLLAAHYYEYRDETALGEGCMPFGVDEPRRPLPPCADRVRVMTAPRLTCRVVLEAAVKVADGAGGFTETWTPLGHALGRASGVDGARCRRRRRPRRPDGLAHRGAWRRAWCAQPPRPRPALPHGRAALPDQGCGGTRSCGPVPDLLLRGGDRAMSYAIASALQEAVYQRLAGDPAVSAATGGHVYDALPSGTRPALYLTLGDEQVRDASDKTGDAAWHDFTLAVVSGAAGFRAAKTAAVAASDALSDADLPLARGRLVSLRFLKARARRLSNGGRRIDLTFRARVEDD